MKRLMVQALIKVHSEAVWTMYPLSSQSGWSGSGMVLGKLPVPWRPTYLE